MSLEWHQHELDPNCHLTACRRYCVSVCDGQWSAWRTVPSGSHFAPIQQKLPDEATAKRICDEDSQR